MSFTVISVKKVFGGYEVLYWASKWDNKTKKQTYVKEKSFYDIKTVWLGVPKNKLKDINVMYPSKSPQVIIGNTQYVEKSVVYLGHATN